MKIYLFPDNTKYEEGLTFLKETTKDRQSIELYEAAYGLESFYIREGYCKQSRFYSGYGDADFYYRVLCEEPHKLFQFQSNKEVIGVIK